MKTIFSLFLCFITLVSCSHQKGSSKMRDIPKIEFTENGKIFNAEIKIPSNFNKPLPLIVVIHEWWGRNQYMKKRVQMLTDEGLAAMAVDLYGDNILVDSPREAQNLAQPFYQNPQLAIQRLIKYIDLAKKNPHIDPDKIFVIGYCFGGTQALNLARSGIQLRGVVSFHGGLSTSLRAKKLNTDLLILNGQDDPMVPQKDIDSFEKEMKSIKASYRIIHYPNAVHAFTNPNSTAVGIKYNLPVAYQKVADDASWKEFMDFVAERAH